MEKFSKHRVENIESVTWFGFTMWAFEFRLDISTREKSTGGHESRLDDFDLLNPVELCLVHQLVELGDDVVEDVQRLRCVLVREEGRKLRQAEPSINFKAKQSHVKH